MLNQKKKVLILGGGFAGLQLAQNLDRNLFEILLIDKQNHHQFQPLFYQVATARLEPSNISFPFRKLFQGTGNVQFRMGEAFSILPNENTVETTVGSFKFDFLVIALGCKTNFFGNTNIAKFALPMKTTSEAIGIRNHILRNFENLYAANSSEREGFLTIVIVGAGPTGVEMAGAFSEMRNDILPKDYQGLDFSALRIILLEGSPNTLNAMSDESKAASRTYLKEMGVEVRTEVFVKDYDGTLVTLSTGETLKSKNVIWAAGVTGNTLKGLDEKLLVRGNRFKVDRFNRIEGFENIFAIGDIAYMETPKYPTGHPQLANVAINQAKNLARNLKKKVQSQPLNEYEYTDLGSMATIGKHKAVVDLPFFKFQGYFAWFVWMFLHLMLILSVRNKMFIFLNWAWSYITKDTTLRLILGEEKATINTK
jgi:NADH dehydrogenase